MIATYINDVNLNANVPKASSFNGLYAPTYNPIIVNKNYTKFIKYSTTCRDLHNFFTNQQLLNIIIAIQTD